MSPEEKRVANKIFKELEDDLVAWCYSIELEFCRKCSSAPEGHLDKAGKPMEVWHVVLIGQNNWNDDPWGEKYSFGSQQEAWSFMKQLGDRWMA